MKGRCRGTNFSLAWSMAPGRKMVITGLLYPRFHGHLAMERHGPCGREPLVEPASICLFLIRLCPVDSPCPHVHRLMGSVTQDLAVILD